MGGRWTGELLVVAVRSMVGEGYNIGCYEISLLSLFY